MMGPEAALVSGRIEELRALGRGARRSTHKVGPMYAEAAARARLEPFYMAERPGHRLAVWDRIRAIVRRSTARGQDSKADWSVAAAPIVAKDVLAGRDSEEGSVGLLAGLPVGTLTREA